MVNLLFEGRIKVCFDSSIHHKEFDIRRAEA